LRDVPPTGGQSGSHPRMTEAEFLKSIGQQ